MVRFLVMKPNSPAGRAISDCALAAKAIAARADASTVFFINYLLILYSSIIIASFAE